MEGRALLSLVLPGPVFDVPFLNLAMCEAALVAVRAVNLHGPVFADLCFEFGLKSFAGCWRDLLSVLHFLTLLASSSSTAIGSISGLAQLLRSPQEFTSLETSVLLVLLVMLEEAISILVVRTLFKELRFFGAGS